MKISCQSCGAKYNIADEKVRGKIVKIACKKCGARIEIDGREPEAQAQDQDETRVFDQAVAPEGGGGGGADTWTASIDDNDQREVNTQQLVDLIRQGVATADTFVWRDGMADWSAIRDVAELQTHLAASAPAPAPKYSEPPTAAYPSAASPSFSGGGGGGYGGSVDTAQPARLGGSRRGGAVDLFAAPAGGEDDQDVATSAPPGGGLGGMGGMSAASLGDQKPLGARNENSVLFSLSALTASGPATPAVAAPSEDEKSGLIDIQKLAQAAKSNNGSRANDDRAKLDDIMNLGGGGAFGSALGSPILAPPPANALTEAAAADEKKSNKGLIIGMGAVVALLLVVVIVLLMRKPDETAKADKPGSALDTPKATEKATADPTGKVAVAAPTETAPADTTGGGIGTPGGKVAPHPGGATAPAGTAAGKATGAAPGATTAPAAPGGKKPCASLEECMKEKDGAKPAATAAPAPAAGGAEFDKGAAKSALGSVPYKDCGTGGAGKVAVTFSPSGSVSGASVSGEYDGGTKSCIQNRFKSAKVPAFSGDPKTVGWSISL